MSGYVAGLCWKAKFGCSTAKAVAVALADHANDDGGEVFPSVKKLASKVEISERSVQRALRKLELMGVILVVSRGGAGPKDTREWCFNLHLIRDVAYGNAQFTMPDEKGDTVAPLEEELRVTSETAKGDIHADKGDMGVTRNVTKLQETSSAPLPPLPAERPQSGQFENSNGKVKSRGIIRIRPGDVGWSRWLQHVEQRFSERDLETIIAAGEIIVTTRWPDENSPLPKIGRAMA